MRASEVMLTAASALGWQGRHWAIHGVRDTSHEVPEIWINELGKWVFFDPSLDTYYADQQSGEPLSLIEMHRIYLKTAFEPGEVQQRGRHFNEERIGKLRGKHPIACMTGNYTYGEHMLFLGLALTAWAALYLIFQFVKTPKQRPIRFTELQRVEVRSRVKRGERKLAEAAELLELSYHQAKRLKKRYSTAGSKALVRGNVGHASNRADDKRRERGSNGNERFPALPLGIAPAIPTCPQPRATPRPYEPGDISIGP